MWQLIIVSREIDMEEDIIVLTASTKEELLSHFHDFCMHIAEDGDDFEILKEGIEDGYFVKGPFEI